MSTHYQLSLSAIVLLVMARETKPILTRVAPATRKQLGKTVKRMKISQNAAVEQAIEQWLERQATAVRRTPDALPLRRR